MQLPSSYVVGSTLQVGRVYKFSAPELLETDVPHYFVVIAIIDQDNYALVSTTQLHKRIAFLTSRGIDVDTLCHIEPTDDNGLTKDSYLDCNKYFSLPNAYLEEKVSSGFFEVSGTISDEDFEKIRYSISVSDLFDIPIDYIVK